VLDIDRCIVVVPAEVPAIGANVIVAARIVILNIERAPPDVFK
jgi:hypothetical protein